MTMNIDIQHDHIAHVEAWEALEADEYERNAEHAMFHRMECITDCYGCDGYVVGCADWQDDVLVTWDGLTDPFKSEKALDISLCHDCLRYAEAIPTVQSPEDHAARVWFPTHDPCGCGDCAVCCA